MALGRITRDQQHFFINTGEVFGVQNITASVNLPTSPIKYIGFTSGSYIVNGSIIGEFAVSQFLITDDVFLPYTGDVAFNGYIIRSKDDFSRNYSFKSGFLTNYSVKCSIGAAIEVATTINAYVDAGGFQTGFIPQEITGSSSSFPLKIADPRSIEINLDEFKTNRVTSFDINIVCKRRPFYMLGTGTPFTIISEYPFDVGVKFQLEVDDYSGFRMSDFPRKIDIKNFDIKIKDYNTDLLMTTYNFKNMTKISETYNSTVAGSTMVSLEYRGFINR